MQSHRWGLAVLAAVVPAAAAAQTDYYNLDRGRPLTVEDPYPTERYALELQLATLRLERLGPGDWRWGWTPELAYGLAPRLQLEVGVPVRWVDAPPHSGLEVEGVEGGLLYQLLWESRAAPALGMGADVHVPRHGPAVGTLRALATRTWPALRVHVNAEGAIGPDADASAVDEPPRWRVGVAFDRTWPLRSMLVGLEGVLEQPRSPGVARSVTVAVGMRRQLSPSTAVDVGLGRRLDGPDRAWFLTVGASTVLSRRAWIAGFARGRASPEVNP